MELVQSAAAMHQRVLNARDKGAQIGLVPTMGYLHEGHLSLMRLLRDQVDLLIVSIFVNPSQFGPGEDLDKYPRDMDRDRQLCEKTGVDLIFNPTSREIYPDGHASWVEFDRYNDILCGASRPGHFRGVGTVVLKLFRICLPHLAAFGRKDAQQLFLIRRMAEDFYLDVDIIGGDIVRESDGLAMSSRNKYLNAAEREQALALSRTLEAIGKAVSKGQVRVDALRHLADFIIWEYPGFKLEYLEFRSWQDLKEQDTIESPALIAMAGRVGKTRLIDNLIIADHDSQS